MHIKIKQLATVATDQYLVLFINCRLRVCLRKFFYFGNNRRFVSTLREKRYGNRGLLTSTSNYYPLSTLAPGYVANEIFLAPKTATNTQLNFTNSNKRVDTTAARYRNVAELVRSLQLARYRLAQLQVDILGLDKAV